MIKIVTIIGARPQIIKAAALSRAIRRHFRDDIVEIIVHTGQHYDENMSEVFFRQLEVPPPLHNLNVGSASHGVQTAQMIERLEALLLREQSDFTVLYGDTNSTLAGALAAAKLRIPVVHIEAGLRSFNKSMPEEINRIVCDHVSSLLFCPTETAVENLKHEGFHENTSPPYSADNPKVFHCGDVMYDNTLFFTGMAERTSDVIEKNRLDKGNFILGTIHRDNNTDQPHRLASLMKAIDLIATKYGTDIVLPLHPRTVKAMKFNLSEILFNQISGNPRIKLLPPASFFDMLVLEKHCRMIMTDSGGVQKEAYFFRKPCIILRSETEWKEIVDHGSGMVTDADEELIVNAFKHFSGDLDLPYPPIFGDGQAGVFICREILNSSK